MLAAALAACAKSAPAPEPTYQGRTLTEWVRLTHDGDVGTQVAAQDALARIGAPAAGRLVQEIGEARGDRRRMANLEDALGGLCPDVLDTVRAARAGVRDSVALAYVDGAIDGIRAQTADARRRRGCAE